jgi:molybdate/tungstate transport system substrate-binding protein
VFQSVGADPITALEPRFTRWYIRYAATSIVVAYNPRSRFASKFRAIAAGRRPVPALFTLLQAPGFQLGRTDPNTDPQGRSFIFMLELAQRRYHLPPGTVTRILGGPPGSASSPQVFEETALDARLQAGQLDAASAYRSQAIQQHLSFITLPAAINLGSFQLARQYATASLTITGKAGRQRKTGKPIVLDMTVIGNADRAAAQAFVRYVLSPAGRARYARGGYTLLAPTAFGATSALPPAIRHELGG